MSTPPPPHLPLPKGTLVTVTGDEGNMNHCFASGTPAKIIGHGTSGYMVEGRDTFGDAEGQWYVDPVDIALVNPEPTGLVKSTEETPEGMLPIGSRVTVTGDTANWEHELWIESSAIVVGYSDNALGGDMGYTLIAAKPERWNVHPDDVKQEETTVPPEALLNHAPAAPDDRIMLAPEVTYGQGPVLSTHRIEALEWTLEHFPEDDVANLVLLANWILTGEYR